jgi:hypothetical protein
MLITFFLSACDSQVEPSQPIQQTTEEQEAVTNDFTLVKACIGKQEEDANSLLIQQGYDEEKTEMYYRKYHKTENGVTKEVHVSAPTYASMVVKNNDYTIIKSVFKQWIQELRASKAYSKLVRSSYSLSVIGNGRLTFSTPEALFAALDTITPTASFSASFLGNDIYANHYRLVLDSHNYQNDGVYMEINNLRAGKPSDDFTVSDLKESDLKKDILICKVDYLTFRYKGFYALNVSGKTNNGDLIPITSECMSPGDFGFIKLYYRDKTNLLLDGTIVWSGCGKLSFPESFRAGLPVKEALPFPGVEYFARLSEGGQYVETADEWEMKHIWQSVSYQKEFQHYYGNSNKKVAVFLYTPSVGLFNPDAAYYLVFVEQ